MDYITPTSVERDGSKEKHNSAELQTKEASGSGQWVATSQRPIGIQCCVGLDRPQPVVPRAWNRIPFCSCREWLGLEDTQLVRWGSGSLIPGLQGICKQEMFVFSIFLVLSSCCSVQRRPDCCTPATPWWWTWRSAPGGNDSLLDTQTR